MFLNVFLHDSQSLDVNVYEGSCSVNYHSLTGYFKAGIPKKYRLASNDAIKSTITKSTNMCCKLYLIKHIMLFSCLLGHPVYKI